MLERDDYQSIDTVFPFIFAFISSAIGWSDEVELEKEIKWCFDLVVEANGSQCSG